MSAEARSSKLNQREIVERFNQFRLEQRNLTMKLFEFEQDFSEHEMVINALSKARPDQRCFRMVGDTLVERTVGEVLPAVQQNRDKLAQIQEEYNHKIVEKGKEINQFKDEYGIQVKDDTLRVERPLGKPSNESVLVEGK